MKLRTNFTVKASVSAAIALAGISFSLLAARSTYGLIYPSLRSLGRTTLQLAIFLLGIAKKTTRFFLSSLCIV